MSRVMVVEDEPAIRRFLEASLLREGHRPILAATLAAALDLLKKQGTEAPDLVILDLSLPDGNGRAIFEAVARVRPGVAFLVCSVYSEPKDLDALLAAGHRVLQKPFTQRQFVEAVQERLAAAAAWATAAATTRSALFGSVRAGQQEQEEGTAEQRGDRPDGRLGPEDAEDQPGERVAPDEGRGSHKKG